MSVKEFRNRKKLTQEEVAELLGIDQTYYSRIESGKASNVGFDKIRKLAEAYDVQVGELAESLAAAVRSASEHTLEYVNRMLLHAFPRTHVQESV